ncbi:acyl-CoA thioesterase domain-containing protein [Nonomuraea diastatica]|uniref:Acyl-CoA thioesterase-like N-terminal HotDog domain-containing protein n=1 Tax=Nonomuraea diastatica TaxID=1848329 RepID=A0A4R4X1F0_9ACTN|nr:hypothetical protein E1294_07045 [Nonomuraea diastatica]
MAMYTRVGEGRYRASEHTQGPWDPGSQHMGPVTALLVHELARTAPRPGLHLSRLVVDVFAPVPVAELRVETDVARDGKRVQCLSASVHSGGREFARASAWRIREAGSRPRRSRPVPRNTRARGWARASGTAGRSTGVSSPAAP